MVDDYIQKIIQTGDDASAIIHQICKETYKFRPEVQAIDSSVGGLTVVRAPPDKKIAVHSCGGIIETKDNVTYALSLVGKLITRTEEIGATPLAMTNTIDMSNIDIDIVRQAAEGLYCGAKSGKIAIINGEIAGLGDRVGAPFNISGTMISLIRNTHPNGCFFKNGMDYIVFEHENKPIFANSDGVGTKIEIAERTNNHSNMDDCIAMLVDDAVKKAATVKALSIVLEKSNETVPESFLKQEGKRLAQQIGFEFTLQAETLGDRVRGYGSSPYNFGGTCISVIDEELLSNMPKPQVGNYIIDIRDPKNPTFRSNGITKVRKGLSEMFGNSWHQVQFNGKTLGELAGAPSTIFYPTYRALLEKKLVSGVYHMSGGAHNGKLARPLASHGLGAEISDLFEPSPLMTLLVNHSSMSLKEAYEVWNMGNEGYVTTTRPEEVITILKNHGLDGKVVGNVNNTSELKIKLPSETIVYKKEK